MRASAHTGVAIPRLFREPPKKQCHCEPVRRLVWQSPGYSGQVRTLVWPLPGISSGRNPPVLPRTTERTTPMTYYVYILTNAHKNLIYVGVTNDLIRRVYEHKHHLDADSYTAKYNIDQLVYFETTSDVYSAISREKQLKGWNRARKNKLVEMKNPGWEDIYESLLG